jgi:nucleoside-diphosphate-sugar epimerase
MAPPNSTTLIIGAAGAIGKRLCAALSQQGTRVIASDRMEHLPGSLKRDLGPTSLSVGNVDVRDKESLRQLFHDHADEHTTVWNLAAPLSVETAMDPGSRQR